MLFKQTKITFESICTEHRPRTYTACKTEIGLENHLTKIKKWPNLGFLIHNLMIEYGRQKHIPRESPFCPFCCNTVDTEMPFLLICLIYTALRIKMINSLIFLRPSKEESSNFYCIKLQTSQTSRPLVLHPVYTVSSCTLCTQSLRAPCVHSLFVHPVYTVSSCTLCTQSLRAPCVHSLFVHPVYTVSSCTLCTQSIRAPCVHSLFVHPVYTVSSCTLCTHTLHAFIIHIIGVILKQIY